jgi:uncharacterized protein (DUF433 family)
MYHSPSRLSQLQDKQMDAVSKTEVVSDPSVMSGEPVVRGTRVPAQTIVACGGYDPKQT